MQVKSEVYPEDLVVAALYRAGTGVRIVDDRRLAEIFGNAAVESPTFSAFKLHPHYRYSRILSDTLQLLDLGGSIVRENAPAKYFKASEHTLGPYGRDVYDQLSEDERTMIDALADRLKVTFGGAVQA